MSRKRKLVPSPAMAVALLALFAALGGSAYAAIVVTGKQVRNGSLTGVDFKQRSLHGSKLRADSIGGGSIKESTLGPVQALAHQAVVAGSGALARGRGVTGATRTGAARYRVRVDVNAQIRVRPSAHRVRFVHPRGWSYYATLRRKLRWYEGVV